jgi:hypothetical protein
MEKFPSFNMTQKHDCTTTDLIASLRGAKTPTKPHFHKAFSAPFSFLSLSTTISDCFVS